MPRMITKASNPPDRMAGIISGSVTRNIVPSGPTPEISEASSSEGSMFRSVAAVNMKTYGA